MPIIDRRKIMQATAGAATLGLASGARAAAPIAETRYGKISGRKSGDVYSFLGVRYGADTGAARFQPPRPPEPWTDVRAATAYGSACPQRSNEADQDEDCLFLNVWTRRLAGAEQRPVLVYFHGGAYATGSGSSPLYEGTRLVERGDVVVVTVNHRLGVFGYGYFSRLGAPESWADSGNLGQLDLILALQWVRDNIAEFGGDPANVTVFGQSGGGAKIATLMATPAAKGLFHKAWTMSGQQVTASGPLNATRRSEAFLDELGVKPADIARIGALPADELVAALRAVDPVFGRGPVYFGPTLDMRSLKRHPFYPDAPAQSHAVPMVLGNTKDETRAFLSGDPKNFELTWAELPDALAPQLRVDISPEWVVEKYREMRPNMSPSEVFFAATTAGRSWRGQVEEAERRAASGAVTWVYQLNWETPKDGGKLGAPHTLDIPLVFDTTGVRDALSTDSAEARSMATILSEALLAFAKSGTPEARLAPDWPQYTLAQRGTMIMDLPPRVEYDPRGDVRRLFETVPYVQPGT